MTLVFNYWEMNNKQQSCTKHHCLSRTYGQKDSQTGTIVHIFTLLPQFRIIVFISKFVRLHSMLSFQNKHTCLAICGPQCESVVSHIQVRINEAEMLHFHSKLPDTANKMRYQLGTSWKCFRVCVGLQSKMHMFREHFLPFTASKITDKVEITRNARILAKLQQSFVDVTIIVLW